MFDRNKLFIATIFYFIAAATKLSLGLDADEFMASCLVLNGLFFAYKGE